MSLLIWVLIILPKYDFISFKLFTKWDNFFAFSFWSSSIAFLFIIDSAFSWSSLSNFFIDSAISSILFSLFSFIMKSSNEFVGLCSLWYKSALNWYAISFISSSVNFGFSFSFSFSFSLSLLSSFLILILSDNILAWFIFLTLFFKLFNIFCFLSFMAFSSKIFNTFFLSFSLSLFKVLAILFNFSSSPGVSFSISSSFLSSSYKSFNIFSLKSFNLSFSNSFLSLFILFLIIPFTYCLIPFILFTKLFTFSIFSFLFSSLAFSFKIDNTFVWSFLFKSFITFAALFIFFSLSFSSIFSLLLNKSPITSLAKFPNCSSFNSLPSTNSFNLLLLNALIISYAKLFSSLFLSLSLWCFLCLCSFLCILLVNFLSIDVFFLLSALSFNIWRIFSLSLLCKLFIISATLSIFSSSSFLSIYFSTLFIGTSLFSSSSNTQVNTFSAKSKNSSSFSSCDFFLFFSLSLSDIFSNSIFLGVLVKLDFIPSCFLTASNFPLDNLLIILSIFSTFFIFFTTFLYFSKFFSSAAFVLRFPKTFFCCSGFKSFMISTALFIFSSSIFSKCLSSTFVSSIIVSLLGNKSSINLLFKSSISFSANSFFLLSLSLSLSFVWFIFSLINLLIYDFKLFVFFIRLFNLLNCSFFLSLFALSSNFFNTIFWSSLFKIFIAFATFFIFSSFSLSASLFSALVLGSSSCSLYKSTINPSVKEFNSSWGNFSFSFSLTFSPSCNLISFFKVCVFFNLFFNSFILLRLFKVETNLSNFSFCFGFFILPLNFFMTCSWSLLS